MRDCPTLHLDTN